LFKSRARYLRGTSALRRECIGVGGCGGLIRGSEFELEVGTVLLAGDDHAAVAAITHLHEQRDAAVM